jgi:GT2 family glycosyltransferase
MTSLLTNSDKNQQSLLKIANTELSNENYALAIKFYLKAIVAMPSLANSIHFNLYLAQKRYWASSKPLAKKVVVCDLSLSANHTRRDETLDLFLKSQEPVNHIDFLVLDNNSSMSLNSKSHSFNDSDGRTYFSDALAFVLENPSEKVILLSSAFTNVVVGFLYRWVWGADVFLYEHNVENDDGKLLAGDEVTKFIFIQKEINRIALHDENCARIAKFYKRYFLKIESINNLSSTYTKDFNSSDMNASNIALLSLLFEGVNFDSTLKPKVVKHADNIAGVSNNHSINSTVLGLVNVIAESSLFDVEWYSQESAYKFKNLHEAILHYIQHGASLGYDPSESFSTTYYLNRYTSVKKANINPLFHYIKYGKAKGNQVKEVVSLSDKKEDGKVDVYISCWLRNRESLHDGLISLYNHIRASGFRARFITHSEALLAVKEIDAINVDFSILGTSAYSSSDDVNAPKELEQDVFAVLEHRLKNIGNFDLLARSDELMSSIRKAYSYWANDFKKNNPKFVLVWGSTCPMSRLHIYLCKMMSIPYLVMERGHFAKTLGVDSMGQFAFSSNTYIPSATDFNPDKYEKLAQWVRSVDEVPYSHRNQKVLSHERIMSAKASSRLVILFIGVNDVGSGVAYSALCESHSVFYHSSFDALQNVIAALKLVAKDALLIVKPHPADKSDYSSLKSENIIIEEDGNINELIVLSDLCITMSTTSIARCVIEEKPIVTMSLTDVSGHDVAYECNDPSELVAKIRSAIHREGWSKKNSNGKAFIQYIFENKLFSVDGNSLFQSVAELADRICKKASMFSKLSNVCLIEDKRNSPLIPCNYTQFDIDGALSVPPDYRLNVDVIIPVYADAALTKAVVDKALSCLGSNNSRIIIINDASPDPEVHKLFAYYSAKNDTRLIVLENKNNLGFSGTVNKAIEYSASRDVIVLNSDAIVPDGFVEKMKQAAYSHYKIATVTPFSNNAGVYSVPLNNIQTLDLNDAVEQVDLMNAKLQSGGAGKTVLMPVGHGFCMYMRRSALREIGCFDELLFGRGYSEEVDYCLRARSLGFHNVALPSLYVGHIGGVSFGSEANAMKIKNRKIIEQKYAGYFDEMRAFRQNDPLSSFRVT